jgi:hypothetical protein
MFECHKETRTRSTKHNGTDSIHKRKAVVAPRTLSLLVDDGVNSDSSLASLPVTDDELTLAAANRDESIHSLQACLHGLVH